MRVYVETNFVLELALAQAQAPSCEEILSLAERGKIDLILPAFSLVEPFDTLRRRHGDRVEIHRHLDKDMKLLSRSHRHKAKLVGFRDVTRLLLQSTELESEALFETWRRVLAAGHLIPLSGAVLQQVEEVMETHDLQGQDAVVLASVLQHLTDALPGDRACFINLNRKDFFEASVKKRLLEHGCQLIDTFSSGLNYIHTRLN